MSPSWCRDQLIYRFNSHSLVVLEKSKQASKKTHPIKQINKTQETRPHMLKENSNIGNLKKPPCYQSQIMNTHIYPYSHPQNQGHDIQASANTREMENVLLLHPYYFEAFTWDSNFMVSICRKKILS